MLTTLVGLIAFVSPDCLVISPKVYESNFIIYWKDPEKENECKIILPELNFER
jgi:hypothetical protein